MEGPRRLRNGRNRDVVVIGGSAGALEPLKMIVSDLPADLQASVLVALHHKPDSPSLLAPILNRSGALHAVTPRDGDPLRSGYIYVAPPNRHLEVTLEGIRCTHGPRINGVRPSIDVLFKTAAETCGPHVVGVLLSGGMDDGSSGLAAIARAGGVTIVQDPAEALIPSMPENAIAMAAPSHVARMEQIAELIVTAVKEPAHRESTQIKGGGTAMPGPAGADDVDGKLTGMTCPECHGSIWMVGEPGQEEFRCRIGHSYAPESFFEIQSENVENALWAGVRSLEEQASFAEVMATRSKRIGDEPGWERYEHRRRAAAANAEVLRRLLLAGD